MNKDKNKKKIIVIKKTQESSKPKKTKDPSKKDTSKGIAREVKYIYPDDCTDILSRKTFRGKIRSKIKTFELALSRIEDKESTKYKKLNREFKDYKKTVIKS